MSRKILRPHQKLGIHQISQSLKSGKRRPLLMAPTGYGKTLVAAKISEMALARNKPALFMVPAISLIDQTVASFAAEGITDVGVIQADHHMTAPDRLIQVASAQTLMRRKIPHAAVVMIDEAHRWFEFYANWMGQYTPAGEWVGPEEWRDIPFIGLSATPWTRGLGKYYDDLLVPATIEELIDKGYLSPFRVFAPSHPDLSGVKTVQGDYEVGGLSEVMSEAKLVADVVETWTRNGEGRSTLCFAVDRAHAKFLQAQFHRAGVPTDYVDAFTGREERIAIEQRFRSGTTKVVCNVGVLTTGVDWDVRCIILARPTKSEMLFVQIIGRGLRPVYADWFNQSSQDDEERVRAIKEGPKPDCLIFDHSDTHLRLGFVTDIFHDELDKGQKGKATSKRKDDAPDLPKECTKCGFVKQPKVHQCPSCGFKPEKVKEVEAADGSLEEITKGGKRLIATTEEKKAIYGQLKRHATLYGYANGWVYHKFKEYFGFFPHWEIEKAPEIPVTPEISSWIRSRQIAWSKSKKRKENGIAA